jgi:colanic acid/amylovoran biosynthesis protein
VTNNFKIGLFGMYGLYNFGCEAIVRGTYELLKKAWPNCKIILYTNRTQEDQKIVSDLDIEVKQVPKNSYLFLRRLANRLLRTVSIKYQILLGDPKSIANECDVIFSVGGDIYTIPKHILNNKNETNYNSIVEFGKTILKYKPLVIWGASIGPFGDKPIVKKYYFEHLKKIRQIFCREEKTFNYLKVNGITSNIQLCCDPAFYINTKSNSNFYLKNENVRIALNLSALSIREQIGENLESFKDEIIHSILEVLSIANTEIVLVPHVLSPVTDDDNDLSFLRKIYESIPKEYIDSISLLEDAKGFLVTKEFLRTCDIVIAARMHCAINAVCEGIPTIFLTYSQKGLGMANYIYGDSKWAIPIMDIKKELRNKTFEMLTNKDVIEQKIKTRIKEIKSDESRIIELLKKIVQ